MPRQPRTAGVTYLRPDGSRVCLSAPLAAARLLALEAQLDALRAGFGPAPPGAGALRDLLAGWLDHYGRREGRGCRLCNAAPETPCTATCLQARTIDAVYPLGRYRGPREEHP